MMLDLTLLLATPITKVVMDKFFEGAAGAASKLGLGQLVWQRGLSQKPNSEVLLQQAR